MEATPSLAVPRGVWDAEALGSIVKVLLRQVRPLLLSRAEREFLRTIEQASELAATAVRAASDEEELDVLLEQLVENPDLLRLELQAAGVVPRSLLEEAARSSDLAAEDFPMVGSQTASVILEAIEYERAILEARLHLLGSTGQPPGPPAEATDVLATLASNEVPAPIGQALFSSLIGEASLLALLSLLHEGAPSPWMSRALAQRWRDGKKELLRVLASVPGLKVDEQLVSASERFDFETLSAGAQRYRARIRKQLDDARSSVAPVFPPEPIEGD